MYFDDFHFSAETWNTIEFGKASWDSLPFDQCRIVPYCYNNNLFSVILADNNIMLTVFDHVDLGVIFFFSFLSF